MFLWKLLVGLRLLLTVFPQSGYIHPDEFFQSLEVVAGDVLNVKVQLPWEFNTTVTKEPIRNIVIPYVMIGFPLYLMKCLSELTETFLQMTLLTPYVVLAVPRLTMTFVSLWTDAWLHRICKMTKLYPMERLTIYASSYVVIVFMSRTLSNAIECFLYAYLLMTVTECIREMDFAATKRRKTEKRNTTNPSNLNSDLDLAPRCNQIAIAVSIGTFNRPTFLAFAFVPIAIWTFYGFRNPLKNLSKILSRCFALFPGFFVVTSFFVVCDSLYYGRITVPTLLRWNSIVSTRWIVTPLNFVLYNVNGENLTKHGLHSNYVHFLFNNLLLFNVLGAIGIVGYVKMLHSAFYKRQLTNITAVDKMMSCGYAFPLLILSFFPHQEPRFIIPVLFPLVYSYANKLTQSSRICRFGLGFWIGFNLFACGFFGFLHQGGVVPSLVYLQQTRLSTDSLESVNHVVYYHTYMPPTSLLLVPKNSDECGESDEFRVHDLMGQPIEALNRKLESLRGSVYVVSPTSLRNVVTEAMKPYSFNLHKWFWSHLSMEDPPPLDSSSFFDGMGLDLHIVEVWKNVTRVQYFSSV